MSVITIALLGLVEGDQELLDVLVSLEVITRDALGYRSGRGGSHISNLVRELEVNWAGVEVILRMRQQLLCARLRQRGESLIEADGKVTNFWSMSSIASLSIG